MTKTNDSRTPRWRGKRTKQYSQGFTLVELLTVMAIMALMTGAAVSAVSAIKDAGGVTKAASDIAGTLDQARSYAMANNTYAFVGLAERDGMDPSKNGNGQVVVMVAGSKDGTRDFGGSGSNLRELTKVRRLDNLRLTDTLPNTGDLARPEVAETYRLGNDSFAADDKFTAAGYEFTKIIQFDPRGTASIPSGSKSIPQWMEIALVPARGAAVEGKGNCAALVLDGVTGSTKIYRP